MNDQQKQHETVDDAARRDRLERAMTTRAARWCAEIVTASARDAELNGRPRRAEASIADGLAAVCAANVVRIIYVQGHAADDFLALEDAAQHRALTAWSHLLHLVRYPENVVPSFYEGWIGDLEAADAAITWQLESERIAR